MWLCPVMRHKAQQLKCNIDILRSSEELHRHYKEVGVIVAFDFNGGLSLNLVMNCLNDFPKSMY